MIVAGVDGCSAGWVAFKVQLPSLATSIEVVVLQSWLSKPLPELAFLGIDIPIGLLDGSRACDKAARKLLGQPRGTSVFAAPCRAAVHAATYKEANAVNRLKTTRGAEPAGLGHRPKNQDSGRRNHARLP